MTLENATETETDTGTTENQPKKIGDNITTFYHCKRFGKQRKDTFMVDDLIDEWTDSENESSKNKRSTDGFHYLKDSPISVMDSDIESVISLTSTTTVDDVQIENSN